MDNQADSIQHIATEETNQALQNYRQSKPFLQDGIVAAINQQKDHLHIDYLLEIPDNLGSFYLDVNVDFLADFLQRKLQAVRQYPLRAIATTQTNDFVIADSAKQIAAGSPGLGMTHGITNPYLVKRLFPYRRLSSVNRRSPAGKKPLELLFNP